MRDLVSVIMSTYNEKTEYIEQAINSILCQTWDNIEIIIVIDNPENKGVTACVKKYGSDYSNITVIQNEKNIGLAKSLNKALDKAAGKYIARMDADDISFSDRIKEEIEFMNRYHLDMVGSKKIDIDEQGNVIRRNGKAISMRRINNVIPYANVITHSSVLIKTEVVRKMSGYRDFKAAQDYDLWLRMLTEGYVIGIIDKELIYYRIRSEGTGIKNAFLQRLISEYVQKLYKERKKTKKLTDSHSDNKLKSFLLLNQYDNEVEIEKYNRAFKNMKIGFQEIYEHKMSGYILLVKSLKNKHIRKFILNLTVMKLYKYI